MNDNDIFTLEPAIPKERELTVMQRLFVLAYIINFNATQAAIKAGYSKTCAAAIGSENLKIPAIRRAIDAAIEERMNTLRIEANTVLYMWYKIATVDRNELVQVRRIPCGSCYDSDPVVGEQIADPDCPKCAGRGVATVEVCDTTQMSEDAALLYEGAKVTKYGVEVLISDRTKALDNLARHLGMYNDKLDHTTNGKDIPSGLGHFYGRKDEVSDET